MIDNGRPFPCHNSLDNLTRNAYGSCDLTFGPHMPDGAPENKLDPHHTGRAFFVLFRLYGPSAAYYDQTWRPGEIELIRQPRKDRQTQGAASWTLFARLVPVSSDNLRWGWWGGFFG
jgi:hypothetical protein